MDGRILEANDAFLRMVGYDHDDLVGGRLRWTDLLPPERPDQHTRAVAEAETTGAIQPSEREYVRKDGSRVPVLRGGAMFEEGGNQGVAFVLDLTERKRAEKALRESEERFRTLMQFSFDVYWETDAQHRFIRQDFSERVTDGPLPDSELGKTRWEMPHLEIDEEAWRKHREMLDAHLPFRDLEYARPTPNGGKRWATVSGLPLFDEAGNFIGYRGVARHITERKQIEEALRQREKELREIVETIPAMTVTITADGRDAFIGKRFSEYSGLSEEEARGSGWKVTVHPDDLDLYLRKWRASLASGDPVEFETRVRRADGEYRWFLARAVAQRDENGNILKWYEVLTDIEDRKRAEAVLRESEAQVRRLVDANIIGVFTWRLGRGDEAGDYFFQDVNDAFLRIVGYDRNDLAGGAVSQRILTPPDWQDRTERAMAEMKLTGAVPPYEKEYIRKDGSRVPVLVGAAEFGETGDHGVAFVLDLTEQKRAAAALRERDATVRGLIDANIIGTFTWRRDKAGGAGFPPVFQDVNDAFLRIVGYDREDLATGTSTWIFTPPDWVDRTQLAAEEMQLNGAFQPYEKEFIRKDGSRVPVLVGAAQTGDSGIAFVLDLTEQKRAEAVLRESEARVRHLIDANIIGIFIGDFDGNIVDANDTYLRLLGYDREDLLSGRINWVTITPPELLYRSERALQEMKSVGKARLYEKEYIRKDGSRVPALVGATIFGEGRGLGFVLDLTEQKRAEAALRESEEQWKAVFENNPIMYFMVDEAGTIMSVNPFGAEQLGYRVDELVGRPVQSVFYEADRDAVYGNACICFRQPGQAMSWELRKVRKNGKVIWVRETARATLINNRLVLLIVCEDITEGKRAAETLREVQMELAHANRVAALGQLTASIAHEVNQPIAAAHNNAGAALHFLDSRPPDLEEVREALNCVVNDTDRAGAVISRIRTLVKKAPPRTESLDINEAIRDVIVVTRGEAAKNGISIEVQLAEALPHVLGDRVQLQQVILNMIINAIEAMTGVAGPRKLLIKTTRSESDDILVAVQDTGPGLAPESLSRAFEAFYTTKPDGLGIGLSICCSIVEAHGGRLWASANVPRGATFQFTVPAPGEGHER